MVGIGLCDNHMVVDISGSCDNHVVEVIIGSCDNHVVLVSYVVVLTDSVLTWTFSLGKIEIFLLARIYQLFIFLLCEWNSCFHDTSLDGQLCQP